MDENEQPEVRRSPWHIYPRGWKTNQWLVPFSGDNAIIHHGHASPDDHSLCGPMVYCCAKSQRLFIEAFPDSAEAKADWQLTDATHISAWLDAGVQVIYFIFCDPIRPEGLLAGGLSGREAQQALFKEIHLEQFADRSSRLI